MTPQQQQASLFTKSEAIPYNSKDQRELVWGNHTNESHKPSEHWSACTVNFTFTKPGRMGYLRDIATFVVGQSNGQLYNL